MQKVKTHLNKKLKLSYINNLYRLITFCFYKNFEIDKNEKDQKIFEAGKKENCIMANCFLSNSFAL